MGDSHNPNYYCLWVHTHICMPVRKIDFDKQDVVKCDERGRATLGSEYANQQVFVYIAELPEPDELVRPPTPEGKTTGKLYQWARDKDFTAFDIDVEEGWVEDKHGERYDAPFDVSDYPFDGDDYE